MSTPGVILFVSHLCRIFCPGGICPGIMFVGDCQIKCFMNIYGNSVRVNYVQLFMSYRANGHLDAN